ncbi:hypothetical protein Moror_7596 [Moniliophthora roreri MCA 2997]|uniref:Transcription activator GCR1-like domain-containing protein n=1 Tax=Moniliophthora roreri (strain MCA 2997) TaxID=1381753 RepID=V2WUK5_MONRO|nr:hypothetical protein Moror_7596 [Moniliophthora roreri MCA 2997]
MGNNKHPRSPSPPVGLPPAQRRKVRDSETASLDSPRRMPTNESIKTPTSPLKPFSSSGELFFESHLEGTIDSTEESTRVSGMSKALTQSGTMSSSHEQMMPFSNASPSNPAASISAPPRPSLTLPIPVMPDSISAPPSKSSTSIPHPAGIFTAMEDHLRTLNLYTETRKAELQFVEESLGRKTSELHEIEAAVATKTVELRDLTLQIAEQKEILEQLNRERDGVKEKMRIEMNELLEAYERDLGRFMDRSKEMIGVRFKERIDSLGKERPSSTVSASQDEFVDLEGAKTTIPREEEPVEDSVKNTASSSQDQAFASEEPEQASSSQQEIGELESASESPQRTVQPSTENVLIEIEEDAVELVPKVEGRDSIGLGSPLTEEDEAENLNKNDSRSETVDPWFFYFQGETEVEIEEFSEAQCKSMDCIKALIGQEKAAKHREWEWTGEEEWLPRYIFRHMKDLSRWDIWAEFEYGFNGNLPVKLLYEHWSDKWLSDTKDAKKARDRKRFYDLVEGLKIEQGWTTKEAFGFLDVCYPITGKKDWKDKCSTVGKFITWIATDKTNAVKELREKAEDYRPEK